MNRHVGVQCPDRCGHLVGRGKWEEVASPPPSRATLF